MFLEIDQNVHVASVSLTYVDGIGVDIAVGRPAAWFLLELLPRRGPPASVVGCNGAARCDALTLVCSMGSWWNNLKIRTSVDWDALARSKGRVHAKVGHKPLSYRRSPGDMTPGGCILEPWREVVVAIAEAMSSHLDIEGGYH